MQLTIFFRGTTHGGVFVVDNFNLQQAQGNQYRHLESTYGLEQNSNLSIEEREIFAIYFVG